MKTIRLFGTLAAIGANQDADVPLYDQLTGLLHEEIPKNEAWEVMSIGVQSVANLFRIRPMNVSRQVWNSFITHLSANELPFEKLFWFPNDLTWKLSAGDRLIINGVAGAVAVAANFYVQVVVRAWERGVDRVDVDRFSYIDGGMDSKIQYLVKNGYITASTPNVATDVITDEIDAAETHEYFAIGIKPLPTTAQADPLRTEINLVEPDLRPFAKAITSPHRNMWPWSDSYEYDPTLAAVASLQNLVFFDSGKHLVVSQGKTIKVQMVDDGTAGGLDNWYFARLIGKKIRLV